MKRIFFSMLFLLACIGCQHQFKYTYRKFIVGAMSDIIFYCRDDTLAQRIIDDCDKELVRLHGLLNRFSDTSLVSELNQAHRVAAPGDIIELFALCDSISRMTTGRFDISIAPLVELWGFYEHEYRDPDSLRIARVKNYVKYQNIKINEDSIFIDPDMEVDLGGIAQGYAADRVAMILRANKIISGLVNIGGEIVAIGRSPEDRPWRIGIKHPRKQGIIETMEIEDMALSTSGDYEKFFTVDNKRLPHIIDPLTGYPAQQFVSVTILDPSASFADAIATAVAIMGYAEGLIFLDSLNIQGIIYYEKNGVLQRIAYP
ncbi:FAD:protein FMN transferase [candidate division WOR-3 bacterium]|nr:FAD:protein FMN transferase [candidate division WOR-3 bacterium]